MLKGKKIVLGITGSIAAYKACFIIRGLIKRGAEVQVVITPAGKEFITPITLSALTHKPVISEFSLSATELGTRMSTSGYGLMPCSSLHARQALSEKWQAVLPTICLSRLTCL